MAKQLRPPQPDGCKDTVLYNHSDKLEERSGTDRFYGTMVKRLNCTTTQRVQRPAVFNPSLAAPKLNTSVARPAIWVREDTLLEIVSSRLATEALSNLYSLQPQLNNITQNMS